MCATLLLAPCHGLRPTALTHRTAALPSARARVVMSGHHDSRRDFGAQLFTTAASGLVLPSSSLAATPSQGPKGKRYGKTGEVVGVVDGIQQRRLGNSDIIVSEMGLGTQRWVSSDFNGEFRSSMLPYHPPP